MEILYTVSNKIIVKVRRDELSKVLPLFQKQDVEVTRNGIVVSDPVKYKFIPAVAAALDDLSKQMRMFE
jgi:hypothetical protein